jgi:diguanylate cyclase (GGDEF)-like protein
LIQPARTPKPQALGLDHFDRSVIPVTPHAAGIALDDWDAMFGGLVETLTRHAGDWLAQTPQEPLDHPGARARSRLMECLDALRQLHASLPQHGRVRTALESEVVSMRAALVHARAEEFNTKRQTMHDALTDLPNRTFFDARLDYIVAHADPQHQSLAVLYIDLDDFKTVNDAHGYGIGDALLKIVATRLAHAVRAGDLMSRFGGDEFGCVLAGSPGREHLSHLACKLLDAVSAPLQIGTISLSVRPSIGIAMWPSDGISPDALLRNADSAMYRAKQKKCGYAFFNESADVWVHQCA